MRAILFSLVIVIGLSASAEQGQDECYTEAMIDLISKTPHYATLDQDSIHVVEIDDRRWNPTKYVWFSAIARSNTTGRKIRLVSMIQRSGFYARRNCAALSRQTSAEVKTSGAEVKTSAVNQGQR